MFDHIIHIPMAVWRAYVRRVRAAAGRRKLAWIVVPIVGLLLLIGMLAPTPEAAPTLAAAPTARRTPTRQAAPTATLEPVVDVAPTEPTAAPEQPTEAPAVDEPAAAPVVDAPAAAPVSGPVEPTGDECPPEAMIKGNQGKSDWIYHRPGGSSYSRTDPEQCFATAADAEAAGYRAAKR